jgi:rhamnogalacturonan endolyase
MSFILFIALSFSALQPVLAAFGVTSTGNAFRVDTAGGLVFDVNKYVRSCILVCYPDTKHRSNGDITSLLYRGTQYQASEKGSHINSGLG